MQELAFDEWAMKHLPTVEILEAGLPCSGASVAGRAKRSLALAEEHPEVGHLVVSFLMVIARVKPAVVLLENVKQYLTTGSMPHRSQKLTRRMLKNLTHPLPRRGGLC